MTPTQERTRTEQSPPILDEAEAAMAKAAQRCIMAALDHSRAPAITLVDESGHQTEPAIKIPPHALRLIAQVLGAMGERRPITIVPTKHEFTTVEAAHYLNVSRPFIIKEIETGKLKHRMVGTHRRIAYHDLEEYKRKMLGLQEKSLQQLADNAQELGLGYWFMAGHARYTAILDACVLFPPAVADALISLHVAGLYTARWTHRIDTEWINAASRDHQQLKEKLTIRRDAMWVAVVDWEVTKESYESLIVGRKLPDPNDEHVIAAALAGHADCIVTSNLKHFPDAVLAPLEIEAIHPDDFIVYQIDLDAYSALAAFKNMRARLRNPPMNAEDFVEAIERNQLTSTASRLREAIKLI